jgi:hypothetical protein
LIDRSPLLLLSGLGAMSAVILLVYKDTLLSFVASAQANHVLPSPAGPPMISFSPSRNELLVRCIVLVPYATEFGAKEATHA